MIIPVVGFDPSLTAWGIAEGQLDLDTGELSKVSITLIETKSDPHKQVRVNSSDLQRSQKLAETVIEKAKNAKVIFAEVPVGSQSARAMCAYGVCVGILGTLIAMKMPIIQVTASEVKRALTGNPNASKKDMIDEAVAIYSEIEFPRNKAGKPLDKCEHMADAIASIHAGVKTDQFRNLVRLL